MITRFLFLAFLTDIATAAPTLPVIPDTVFNVTNYNAVGDGATANTAEIQAAIDAAGAKGGGIVEVPAGVFLSGPIQMASSVNLRIERGAVLRMLPLARYPGSTNDPENFISGSKLHDVAISGAGLIDGQGAPWWPFAKTKGVKRPRMIALSGCDRVLIEGVTLKNSPMFHMAIGGNSSNITVRRVTVRAPASTDPVEPSHNTDACNISGHHALVQDCDISTGDDNFTCGGNTSDIVITNCAYGNGHGVSIGSPTHGGVANITVVDCTFSNTDCGIRIKSDRDRGGVVRNLTYRNLRMTNVGIPILIYGQYAATNREYRALHKLTAAIAASYPAAPVTDRTPVYRDITFSNITATAARDRRAGLIWGLPEAAVSNVVLQQVTITADKPFGIYNSQAVRLVDCRIVTPEGVNQLSVTNAQVEIANR
jgi:polygalacturonase